jgi:RNA polymerase sigma-70 factor (ECF subfamily)
LDDIEKAYTLYARDVYKYLLSLTRSPDTAEELTQETFYRAISTIKSYNGKCKLPVWLCQIAKHLWYQWLEKQNKYKRDELSGDIPSDVSPEADFVLRGEKMALYKAIRTLPEQARELVHMRLTGEFSFAEIGEIMGKSENWARTTFYRAKLKIMENISGNSTH